MLVDALQLPEDTIIEQDICIVGAGAAGITLAREFSNQPYQVCLLESGGLVFNEDTQSLYAGENIGESYFSLKEARARYLGGSTNLWAGWSRPLDEIDFENRPWMPYSGWSFTKAELIPYYERAQIACHLGPFEYNLEYWKNALAQLQRQKLPQLTDQLSTYVWQLVPPTHLRFGEAYRTELEQARNITTYLHANVVEIETNETNQAVTRLQLASTDGKKFSVVAKVFILAAGGIENPRLLLVSNSVQSNGLGNQHDLVGRFFMEHPYLLSGNLKLTNPTPFLYAQKNSIVGETLIGTAVALSKAVQEREQLLNFSTRLLPMQEEWVDALKRLKSRKSPKKRHKAFPTPHAGRKYRKSQVPVMEDLGKVIANLDRLAAKAYTKLFNKPSNVCDMHLIGEQAPNPDSRITLSRDRDKLGLNRVQLDWRLSPIDKYTIQRSQQLIAEEFKRSGLGQVQIELTNNDTDWQALKGSYHHIGTTRMSDTPRLGVVNQHCQVHGINNLYIAGSSVFSTSGLSNPTLTIIALAIRLADRIKVHLGGATKVPEKLEATSVIVPR